MKSDQEQIKKAAAGAAEKLRDKSNKEFKEMLKNQSEKGFIPKNVLGFSDQMVEGIYSQAYRLYNSGRYTDAVELFRLLIMMNPVEAKYVLGLAASFHMLHDYKAAIETYNICATLDADSPIPYYHCSDCLIQMGDSTSAIVALKMAIDRCDNKPQYDVLKERALLTIESLKKEKEGSSKAKKKKK